ncbi:MAG TPA: HEAT repeat domain-containing protein [Longimicrobiales bacterium]|nr:HEAT repeat domain-containing protein [Longimicrobiales bacterium]
MRSTLLYTTFALIVPGAAGAQVQAPRAPAAPAPVVEVEAVASPAPVADIEAVASPAPVMQVALAFDDEGDPQRRIRTAAQPLLLQTWYPQDPADATYRAGRDALMRGDRRAAVRHFDEIQRRWPRSQYAPQSYYWEAFAGSRGNASTDELRRAREALSTLRSRYPDADGLRDADALMQTINAQLAERGDVQSNAAVRRAASTVATQQGCSEVDDENDTRVVALNALLQMDSESALPILTRVLERRDACSAPLRRRAVFLVSQKHSPETADILVNLVRNDPDREVREQAIFWLSQVDGARAVEALEGILRTSRDAALQEKAIFALSQHQSARSAELLRAYAMRGDVNEELRAQAIFWLGQSGGQHASFLRDIYGRVNSDELKEKVIFSIAQQQQSQANSDFLMNIALDQRESPEMRKQALFWANQTGAVAMRRLAELYDRTDDRELKDQLIFAFSQNRDPAAIEKLMDIGRNERDAELRQQAIFWLGQSRDPRVQRFLLELINN